MVRNGDTDAKGPFEVDCGGLKGQGKWFSSDVWSYSLEKPLALGEKCSFKLVSNLKSIKGTAATGKTQFAAAADRFRVDWVYPRPGAIIQEDQVFVIEPTAPADIKAVKEQVWCETDSVGQKIPVQIMSDAARAEVTPHLPRVSRYGIFVSCKSQLAPKAKVQLVWGTGMKASNQWPTSSAERFTYTVREPFEAKLSCERERLDAPCTPLSPITLSFSSPVPRASVDAVRLKVGGKPLAPSNLANTSAKSMSWVSELVFSPPFPALEALELALPADLKDDAGRPLANAKSFPLKFSTGNLPALAKFPGNFGILESKEGGILPVTVRNIEPVVSTATLSAKRVSNDAEVIALMLELERFENRSETKVMMIDGEKREYSDWMVAREYSFLSSKKDVKQMTLPKPAPTHQAEVLGIPLAKPGYYVVEIKSDLLGKALLSDAKPMYVRTSTLVTNMAVHFQHAGETSLVWVTALDSGKPVKGAALRISDCNGRSLWTGVSDDSGRATIRQKLARPACPNASFFVASATLGDDYSFTRSDWNEGIEPWRFGVQTWGEEGDGSRFHTLKARTLLRAGEVLHMKHFARVRQGNRFSKMDEKALPQKVRIFHPEEGSEYFVDLKWSANGTANSEWKIPAQAKLGVYHVELIGLMNAPVYSGSVKVSDFKLPQFTGSVRPLSKPQPGAQQLSMQASLAFLNGGPARNQEVKVTAVVRPRWVHFEQFEQYQFNDYSPEKVREAFELPKQEQRDRLVLDQKEIKLNAKGQAEFSVDLGSTLAQPSDLVTEMTFTDPNGEVQTIRGITALWSSSFQIGTMMSDADGKPEFNRIKAIVLDTAGKPVVGQSVEVLGLSEQHYSHRRRLVGGFYAYENRTEYTPLGKLCSDRTDQRGMITCDINPKAEGQVYLQVRTKDPSSNRYAYAVTELSSGAYYDEEWGGTSNTDRMDVLLDKDSFKANDTARLTVKTPFAQGHALVTVGAGEIFESFVVPLSRFKPTINIPIKGEWAPNAYVSVLHVRGRVQPLAWYSFFDWGWKEPRVWFKAWWNPDIPTAMVDLAKPAYKMGLASFKVDNQAYQLKVEVSPEKQEYKPKDLVQVKLRVRTPDGKVPPVGTEVAVAAVDAALLELLPNDSTDLLQAMLSQRGYEVNTATAQMQVIGKRHFGKKSVPLGGGGGKAPARELFDTLLTWQPNVLLNDKGEATVSFRTNDSLTRFDLMAVATAGLDHFGTGGATFSSKIDLQIISGLPLEVRENDRFQSAITLRNSTNGNVKVKVNASATGLQLPSQEITLPAQGIQEVVWPVQVPAGLSKIDWVFSVAEVAVSGSSGKGLSDQLKIAQLVRPDIPVSTIQTSLFQLDGKRQFEFQMPQAAVAGKGGPQVALRATLSAKPNGLEQFFRSYPYSCLEQQFSKAVGLRDSLLWTNLAEKIPAYQDKNGLLSYFPNSERGHVVLTAYVLQMSQITGPLYGFDLPVPVVSRMKKGLTDFVQGRIQDGAWAPRDIGIQKKLTALAALSRTESVPAEILDSLKVDLAKQPMSALIDWWEVLDSIKNSPKAKSMGQLVEQEIRNRLSVSAARLSLGNDAQEDWWWMMSNNHINAFRLIDVVMDKPTWKKELPLLLQGAMERQQKGHWGTTVANTWASVTLDRFAKVSEPTAVEGKTAVQWHGQTLGHAWGSPAVAKQAPAGDPLAKAEFDLSWGATKPGQQTKPMQITHEGKGKPWVELSTRAAIPLKKPEFFGYTISRHVEPIEQKVPGQFSRGDVIKVTLNLRASQAMTSVVLDDPIPAGAKILGDGDGRDSELISHRRGDQSGNQGSNQAANQSSSDYDNAFYLSFVERTYSGYKAYFNYLPKGEYRLSYLMRLNTVGEFALPPTRAEAMYAPDVFGQLPNPLVVVKP